VRPSSCAQGVRPPGQRARQPFGFCKRGSAWCGRIEISIPAARWPFLMLSAYTGAACRLQDCEALPVHLFCNRWRKLTAAAALSPIPAQLHAAAQQSHPRRDQAPRPSAGCLGAYGSGAALTIQAFILASVSRGSRMACMAASCQQGSLKACPVPSDCIRSIGSGYGCA
jgi:hypothetical protein